RSTKRNRTLPSQSAAFVPPVWSSLDSGPILSTSDSSASLGDIQGTDRSEGTSITMSVSERSSVISEKSLGSVERKQAFDPGLAGSSKATNTAPMPKTVRAVTGRMGHFVGARLTAMVSPQFGHLVDAAAIVAPHMGHAIWSGSAGDPVSFVSMTSLYRCRRM